MSAEEPQEPASAPGTESDAAPVAPARRRLQALVGLLSLALVATLVGVVLLWREVDQQRDEAAALDEAESAANAAVVRMTSYEHITVEEDFSWVEQAGTEDFQEYFEGVSEDAIALIKRLEASATGVVIDSSATSEGEDQVRVLMFVDQEITSVGQDEARLDQPRVSMEMVRSGNDWLVDQVQVNNLLTE